MLGEFLKDSDPHPPTLAILCNWYVREQAGREGAPEPEAVEAALVLLLGGVPPKQREATARRLVALAERLRAGGGGEG